MGTPSASRRTRSPSRLTTSTVASSAVLTNSEIRVASLRPSPLGEKNCASLTLMTGGALLSRWATKNAANVAATSTTKVTWAARAVADGLLGALVLTNDRDHVPVLALGALLIGGQRGLGRVVHRDDLLDPERGRHAAGGALGARPVHHDRRLDLLVLGKRADPGVVARVALADERAAVGPG